MANLKSTTKLNTRSGELAVYFEGEASTKQLILPI